LDWVSLWKIYKANFRKNLASIGLLLVFSFLIIGGALESKNGIEGVTNYEVVFYGLAIVLFTLCLPIIFSSRPRRVFPRIEMVASICIVGTFVSLFFSFYLSVVFLVLLMILVFSFKSKKADEKTQQLVG
jgi:hypothetical protein